MDLEPTLRLGGICVVEWVGVECRWLGIVYMFILKGGKKLSAVVGLNFGSLSMNILKTLYPRFAGVAFDIPGLGLTPRPSSLSDYGEAAAADLGLGLWKKLSWPLSSSSSSGGMDSIYSSIRM